MQQRTIELEPLLPACLVTTRQGAVIDENGLHFASEPLQRTRRKVLYGDRWLREDYSAWYRLAKARRCQISIDHGTSPRTWRTHRCEPALQQG